MDQGLVDACTGNSNRMASLESRLAKLENIVSEILKRLDRTH